MIGVTLPPSTFLPKPELPDPRNGLWSRMRDFIIHSHSEASKGLLRYDVTTNELILGLHPSTFMHDMSLSSYTRKQLAKLGPFIGDEERRFIAISIRDALIHIIVDCDLNVIPCSLLEFLIRVTYAWCYEEQQTRTPVEPNAIWNAPKPPGVTQLISDGSLQVTPRGSVRSSVGSDELKDVLEKDFSDRLFDPRIFSHGVTADDFQAKLEQVTTMPKHEVSTMLDGFLQARELYLASEADERQAGPPMLAADIEPLTSE
eukprot:UN0509